MNNATRKAIEAIISTLNDIEGKVADLSESIQTIAEGEREKFDNLSEGLQASERGQSIEQAADALESAHGCIETIVGELTDCADYLSTAMEPVS